MPRPSARLHRHSTPRGTRRANLRAMIQKRSVAVVGTGSVGVAAAYALFLRRVASEILLADKDFRRAEGHAMDLMHGQALVGNVEVRAVQNAELGRSQVVMIASGRNRSSAGRTIRSITSR